MRLRDVLSHVIELPHVVFPRRIRPQTIVVNRTDGMVRHRLPAVVVDGTRAQHLEVLGVVASGLPVATVAQ